MSDSVDYSCFLLIIRIKPDANLQSYFLVFEGQNMSSRYHIFLIDGKSSAVIASSSNKTCWHKDCFQFRSDI